MSDSRYSKTTSYVDSQGNVVSYTDHDPYREMGEHMDAGFAVGQIYPGLSKFLGVASAITVFVLCLMFDWGWFVAIICAALVGGLMWAFGVYALAMAAVLGILGLIVWFAASTGGFGK
jgi:hypothetical protein